MAWLEKTNTARDKRQDAKDKLREWLQVRRAVLERDAHRCRACGSRETVDVHHIRFRSALGASSEKNCAALCRICHQDCHGYRLAIIGDDANKKLRFVRRA